MLHYLVEHSDFFKKLQSALDCNDLNKFSNLILSLSPKEIVSLSFDETFEISQLFSINSFEKYPELFDYLQLAGDCAINNVMDEKDVRENALLARFFYFCTNTIQSKNGIPDSLNLNSTAVALFKLAKLGIEENKNLFESIRLCEQIQNLFPELDSNHAGSLINEANARMYLAENNIESERNLRRAIELYENARKIFSPNSKHYLGTLSNEADARIHLAKLGFDNCSCSVSWTINCGYSIRIY